MHSVAQARNLGIPLTLPSLSIITFYQLSKGVEYAFSISLLFIHWHPHLSDNTLVQATATSFLDDKRQLPNGSSDVSLAPDQFFLLSAARIIFPNWKSYQVLPLSQVHSRIARTLWRKSTTINMAYSASRSCLYPPLQSHLNLCCLISPFTPQCSSLRLNPLQFPKHTSTSAFLVPPGLCLGSLLYLKLSSPG